jgi:hypothetical protein
MTVTSIEIGAQKHGTSSRWLSKFGAQMNLSEAVPIRMGEVADSSAPLFVSGFCESHRRMISWGVAPLFQGIALDGFGANPLRMTSYFTRGDLPVKNRADRVGE